MYKPQSLQSLVHALMSARGSRLVKKRGCLEYDQDRLNVSDKNLVHLKNWKSPSKQIEKHLLGSVLHVLPTTPLYPAVTFILSIIMMIVLTMKATMSRLQTIHFQIHGKFEPAIVRGALKENKFSFLHLLLM